MIRYQKEPLVKGAVAKKALTQSKGRKDASSLEPRVFEIGSLVEVAKRTWSNINKLGGTGNAKIMYILMVRLVCFRLGYWCPPPARGRRRC